MKRKLLAIILAILTSVTMFTGVATVIAEDKEEIDYDLLISDININEDLDLKIILIIDAETGYNALLTTSDETEYYYAIIDGNEYELEQLKCIKDSRIPEYHKIMPIYGMITDIIGGTSEKEYSDSKSTVYTRESWVAGTNGFGVKMFEVHAKGQFFSDGDEIYYISDQSWEWHDTWWYDIESWTHDDTIISGGDSGIVEAQAQYQSWIWTYGYLLWAWVECYPDGSWDYDYGMQET
jgi:hypothetical protein